MLLIGEHGDYPVNEWGQKLYPRHRLFGEVVQVFREAGRSVPVFCDKHLSYSWAKAQQMYDWSRELRIPLLAGSSIPVTVRTPELAIPMGTAIDRAVQTGYGPLDAYGFHTLEALQCMVERRSGGEDGGRIRGNDRGRLRLALARRPRNLVAASAPRSPRQAAWRPACRSRGRMPAVGRLRPQVPRRTGGRRVHAQRLRPRLELRGRDWRRAAVHALRPRFRKLAICHISTVLRTASRSCSSPVGRPIPSNARF